MYLLSRLLDYAFNILMTKNVTTIVDVNNSWTLLALDFFFPFSFFFLGGGGYTSVGGGISHKSSQYPSFSGSFSWMALEYH